MTTDYNEGQIAEQYRQAKEQPWRLRVETYSFMKLIGDLRGKKVVDAACGTGRRRKWGGSLFHLPVSYSTTYRFIFVISSSSHETTRVYAKLGAKKLITNDLEIDGMFEDAATFLFEACLHVTCDRSHKDSRADGRLPLQNHQSLLWDCKSAEGPVNLQDHLDGQFDGYLRKERDSSN